MEKNALMRRWRPPKSKCDGGEEIKSKAIQYRYAKYFGELRRDINMFRWS